MRLRNGISLIEVIVAIAIIAILLALLLPATQRVREAAIRMQSMNNIKQINLAVQHFASDHDGKVPAYNDKPGSPNPRQSLFFAILPMIEQGAIYRKIVEVRYNVPVNHYVRCFISPADPTVLEEQKQFGPASYAANAAAFKPGFSLAASYDDGTSNTLSFAEHYINCGSIKPYEQRQFMYLWFGQNDSSQRPATFVDPVQSDPRPITTGNPPVTRPSYRTSPLVETFQVAPTMEECNPRVPQTPHRNGMLTGLMDGSVRILAPGISSATYWGAITPAGGEILTSDW